MRTDQIPTSPPLERAADRAELVSSQHHRLDAATVHLEAPLAAVDLAAFDANAADLVLDDSLGTPIRVASKSVRSRDLVERALARPGFAGVLGYSLAEALWLAEDIDDIVLGYPTAEARRARDARRLRQARVAHHPDGRLRRAARPRRRVVPARWACGDSRLHRPRRLAPRPWRRGASRSLSFTAPRRQRRGRPCGRDRVASGFRLVGLMAYEGQVAGQTDHPLGKAWQAPAVAAMKKPRSHRSHPAARASSQPCGGRRPRVRQRRWHRKHRDHRRRATVTEVAAGAGLFAPALFDGYRNFSPIPAAFFALDVTRRPAPGMVTASGGGWIVPAPQEPTGRPCRRTPKDSRCAPWRAPARRRPRWSGPLQTLSSLVTGCGSGTRRPVSSASTPTRSISSSATRSRLRCRRTAARVAPSSTDLQAAPEPGDKVGEPYGSEPQAASRGGLRRPFERARHLVCHRRSVLQAIDRDKYDVVPIGIAPTVSGSWSRRSPAAAHHLTRQALRSTPHSRQ